MHRLIQIAERRRQGFVPGRAADVKREVDPLRGEQPRGLVDRYRQVLGVDDCLRARRDSHIGWRVVQIGDGYIGGKDVDIAAVGCIRVRFPAQVRLFRPSEVAEDLGQTADAASAARQLLSSPGPFPKRAHVPAGSCTISCFTPSVSLVA